MSEALFALPEDQRVAILRKLSHAVGHDIGPNNYRNVYAAYNPVQDLELAKALGLARLSGHGGDSVYVVTDEGKAALRRWYTSTWPLGARLIAYHVDIPSWHDDDAIHAYGDMFGTYLFAGSASIARAKVIRELDCEEILWKDATVRRAFELDHLRPLGWWPCPVSRSPVYALHQRKAFLGPWVHDLLRADVEAKEKAAASPYAALSREALETRLASLEATSAAQARAIDYVFRRVQCDPETHYTLGQGSQAFYLLAQAEAASTGTPLADVEAERRTTFFGDKVREAELLRTELDRYQESCSCPCNDPPDEEEEEEEDDL